MKATFKYLKGCYTNMEQASTLFFQKAELLPTGGNSKKADFDETLMKLPNTKEQFNSETNCLRRFWAPFDEGTLSRAWLSVRMLSFHTTLQIPH